MNNLVLCIYALGKRRLNLTFAGVLVWALSFDVEAQTLRRILGDGGTASVSERPLFLVVALAGLALVPFVLMMVTSFVKIAVVLSVVRQAIGTQQIPPTQVITGLAIVMTTYIMAPVGRQIYDGSTKILQAKNIKDFDDAQAEDYMEMASAATGPLKGFLIKHADARERRMFYDLALRLAGPGPEGDKQRSKIRDEDFLIVIPSFVISELKDAFMIGFMLFVPFLVIDMVVANILMALGMQMLSPTTISLPFKILLFVLVDGWYLMTQGLIITYL